MSPRAPRHPRAFAPQLPPILALPAVLGLSLLVLPLGMLITRVNAATIWADVTSASAISALRISATTALVATALCVLLGIPLALIMARSASRLAAWLRVAVSVPLVLPPMVGGVALLFLFGRTGWLGRPLADAGFAIPFSPVAVVLAQAFVALPFLVLAVEGSLRSVGRGFDDTAAGLGASRWTVLRRVTLPLAAPGIIAGVILCFARAIGEFGATALFAGNAPGVTQTMPLAIYTAFNGAGVSQGTGIALSLLLLLAAVLVLVLVRAWRPGAPR